ncbi:MAG TPA: hypothetical protein VK638_55050, partial [Edaphobacter sp.]|nr:hypothetical protein [Edaphobacter sp.]
MRDDVRDLIQEARREVRRASGIPLTSVEQVEERRTVEIEEMNKFIFNAFHIRLMGPLKSKVIWTDKGAAAQLTVDDHSFHVRKDE